MIPGFFSRHLRRMTPCILIRPQHRRAQRSCTWLRRLNLPEYASPEMVRDRFHAALEHHTGFGFA